MTAVVCCAVTDYELRSISWQNPLAGVCSRLVIQLRVNFKEYAMNTNGSFWEPSQTSNSQSVGGLESNLVCALVEQRLMRISEKSYESMQWNWLKQ